jgi:hypothetical protein
MNVDERRDAPCVESEIERRRAATEAWEAEVDRLMSVQMTATLGAARKTAHDRVNSSSRPMCRSVFLASPHVLVGDRDLGNFEPAATDPVLLWNADRLFWQRRKS